MWDRDERVRFTKAVFTAALVIIVACGSGDGMRMIGDAMMDVGQMLTDAGVGDAAAQPGTGCRRWEYSRYDPYDSPDCETAQQDVLAGENCLIPEGWEPFDAEEDADATTSFTVYIRRCVE
jgi:hypothetical protein